MLLAIWQQEHEFNSRGAHPLSPVIGDRRPERVGSNEGLGVIGEDTYCFVDQLAEGI